MDLLKSMLEVNLEQRISIKDALDHRFFKLRMEEFINIEDILRKLSFREYEEFSKFFFIFFFKNPNFNLF